MLLLLSGKYTVRCTLVRMIRLGTSMSMPSVARIAISVLACRFFFKKESFVMGRATVQLTRAFSAQHPLWSVLFGHGEEKAFICHTSDLFLVEQKPFHHHHRNDLWKKHHLLFWVLFCMHFFIGFCKWHLKGEAFIFLESRRRVVIAFTIFSLPPPLLQDFWDKASYERW